MIEIVIYNIDNYCGKDGAIYMYKHPDAVKESDSMKRYIAAAKESENGIFWYIDDTEELLSYPFGSVNCPNGIAKSGTTYNHKKFWSDLKPKGSKYTYNYYPRGRVDWDSQGRAIIYLNPNIPEEVINQIKSDFGIRPSDECKIQYDYSNHYKCHLDDGWVADK